ncbi:MAG: geranylgeranyl reductase family protein [Acidobacteriaceae bacterium]|nr:geranylgeranyl reductase family protein [Acidobacteriaceae bacterium]
MPKKYDLVVVGGGPAGAAAAWRAATLGAKTLCLDKATFPRSKACGDGLTPRAVSLITEMGLGAELERFHKITGIRFLGKRRWQVGWPDRAGMPSHGYVANRLDLDEMLLHHAGRAGAEIRQSTEAMAAVMMNGRMSGVTVRPRGGQEETVIADAVIAADGAYSPMRRAIGSGTTSDGIMGIAIRAEMESSRCDTDFVEIYPRISHGHDVLPGYAWLFPLGGGRINCGIGYAMTYRRWQDINAVRLFEEFLKSLPREWDLPSVEELHRRKAVGAWRLPMAFAGGPPWRPGILFAGDAAGAVKPSTGAGISRALQCGMAAAASAVEALQTTGPSDFSNYERYLKSNWGRTYRFGAKVHKLAGNPILAAAFANVLDNPSLRRMAIRAAYGSTILGNYVEDSVPEVEVQKIEAGANQTDSSGA